MLLTTYYQPRLTRNSGLDQTAVTIKISPEAKEFLIHRELLCKVSPYFQGAFKGEFAEAKDGAITLDNISVRTFEIVQRWLYSGTLVLPSDSDAYLNPEPTHPKSKVCVDCREHTGFHEFIDWSVDLLDIYVLADKYNFPLLRRDTMIHWQHLHEIGKTFPDLVTVSKIYDRPPENSALYAYMVIMHKRA